MGTEKIQVLIGDDNREFCELLGEYITAQPDMELTGVAHNGLEVLEAIRSRAPHVVILDIIMPQLDGIGVLERLSQMWLSHRPKVLMLTAFGQENITQKVLEMGADYYLLKPFSLDVLGTRLRQLAGLQPLPVVPQAVPANTPAALNRVGGPIKAPRRDLEAEASELIREAGIPPHIKGYRYLRDAVLLVVQRVELLNAITKELYPAIARNHETTPSRVERAIRHAIELAWGQQRTEAMQALFGPGLHADRGKPTNSEFIARAADRLRVGTRAS